MLNLLTIATAKTCYTRANLHPPIKPVISIRHSPCSPKIHERLNFLYCGTYMQTINTVCVYGFAELLPSFL
nr:MAG TPA: hypothetical protein [Caudoviricetes sp.]